MGIRSERNIRPTARARVSSSGSDTDIGNDTHASLVVLGNPTSVPCNPVPILKQYTHEGPGLSTAPETPALSALSALSLPQPAASPRHSPPRTRRVQLCSVVSVVSEDGIETFEKQELRDFIKSRSASKFKNEVFTKMPRIKNMAEAPQEENCGGYHQQW